MPKFNVDFPADQCFETGFKEQINVGAGGGGSKFHDKLLNRELPDQHPIEAITGLQEALDDKLPSSTKIPTKTSDLANDSGFIDKNVTNLANYDTKSVINDKFLGINNKIDQINTDLTDKATKQDIQDLEDGKVNYIYKVIQNDHIQQLDALEILNDYANYEGKLIEFLTNGDLPNKSVAWGFLGTDKEGNTYLISIDLEGITTKWNKDSFERHNFETKNLITEPITDMDNLTIDVEGYAPYLASVRSAINRPYPQETSTEGVVVVIAYGVNLQIQIYTDMQNGKMYRRIITGTDGRHSFGTWSEILTDIPDGDKIAYGDEVAY